MLHYVTETTDHIVTFVYDPVGSLSRAEQDTSDLNHQIPDDEAVRYEVFTDFRPAIGSDVRDIPYDDKPECARCQHDKTSCTDDHGDVHTCTSR